MFAQFVAQGRTTALSMAPRTSLVGRINRLKGQRILIDAATELWNENVRNIKFLIVGGVYAGQEHFRNNLMELIASSPAKINIHVFDFTENVWTIWDASDISVVPSTEPESFGLVALEAMLSRKPVIASNHGGITEVVKDGVTGFLVRPGDSSALADSIRLLISDKKLSKAMGDAGYERAMNCFSLSAHVKKMCSIYDKL